jgi:hypothetical protein
MTKAKIYLCLNYLTSPHNSCIKQERRVREPEGIFKIEVPDNVRKIVIVKAQVHVVRDSSVVRRHYDIIYYC